jgi:DNA-binding MarR family transcriptional regulator
VTGTESGRLANLPPSAEYVYQLVQRHEPVTRQDLLKRTYLTEATLDRALKTLQNEDFLFKTRDSEDLRQVVIKTGAIRTYNPSRN